MTAQLRKVWLDLKGSYWFIPAVLTVLAFALAVATIQLDRAWGPQWLAELGLEASRPEGARAQLTVVTTGMIAVSSTLFAITIAAVAFASGNYGPRLLTNFMNDRGNQVSLGVFVATFVYNLMLLRVVRDPVDSRPETPVEAVPAFVPQLSMLVSGASVAIAVATLVYFLHHIPASIRINSVLAGIGRRLVRDIEERFPAKGGATEPRPTVPGEPVTAEKIGYIEIIEFAALDRLARECGGTIALKARTGDFVHPHRPLAVVAGVAPDERLKERIRAAFSLGASRTPTQDLEFLIDELVEIGLRALSPGINDPFTAVTSIHWMGAAMAKLAERDLCRGPEQESYDPERVQVVADDFPHFLNRSFGAMRPSVAGSALAAKMFLEALWGVAIGATSRGRRDAILREARLLVRQAETALEGPALEEVRERLAQFEERMAGVEG
ncbi:MAG: DUF2254 domain-containing protein [Pseudomonadota bacterium]|nr:DUF2254 domain-containing protein [Pseudomonadota bacterium]